MVGSAALLAAAHQDRGNMGQPGQKTVKVSAGSHLRNLAQRSNGPLGHEMLIRSTGGSDIGRQLLDLSSP